jgi:exosortase
MATAVRPRIWNEKLRLAALDQAEMLRIGMISIIIGITFVMFHLLGNTVENVNSRSAFVWMIARWGDKISFGGADYSHGYLIPFVSLFVLWLRRTDLRDAPKKVCNLGLVVIVMALLAHWVGAKMQQTRISLMGLIMISWGLPFYLYGWHVAKVLIFPCAYLIFCIPLNFLDVISFPLRMIMARISVGILNGIGLESVRQGTAIITETGQFDVADPCSGLRSLLAMTAITAVYAYLTQRTLFRKWFLFVCSIPLAVIGNIARITSLGLAAATFGSEFALGVFHDFAGYLVFAVAITCMVGLGSLLNLHFKEVFARWKSALLSPT